MTEGKRRRRGGFCYRHYLLSASVSTSGAIPYEIGSVKHHEMMLLLLRAVDVAAVIIVILLLSLSASVRYDTCVCFVLKIIFSRASKSANFSQIFTKNCTTIL